MELTTAVVVVVVVVVDCKGCVVESDALKRFR